MSHLLEKQPNCTNELSTEVVVKTAFMRVRNQRSVSQGKRKEPWLINVVRSWKKNPLNKNKHIINVN